MEDVTRRVEGSRAGVSWDLGREQIPWRQKARKPTKGVTIQGAGNPASLRAATGK
jgi:hypothetical protein